MKSLNHVGITGIGCVCAAGADLESCMKFMEKGKRSPAPPSRFSSAISCVHPVFEVPDSFLVSKDFKIPVKSRTIHLALTALDQALVNAGLDREILKNKRVGVCIGTNVAGSASNRSLSSELSYLIPAQRFIATNPSIGIAREYELSGPVQTIVTACSAGGDAIGLAGSWIRQDICDIVIAGGTDEMYEIAYNGFISLMNCDDSPCRPFDADRKGMNLGEGAGIFILESEKMIEQRGITPRAYLMGYGSASDAFHLTTPAPDGRGLCLAIDEALTGAGISYRDIAFINAHGTGTPDNDKIESMIFHELFPGVPFLSTKGYTGHTLGGAGAVEAAFTIAGLEKGKIPPSAGFSNSDPELPANPVSDVTEIKGCIAMSQTLAFGGNNAVLVLGKLKIQQQ